MPWIETIIRKEITIVNWPVKLLFLLRLINCINIFLDSTIHKVESPSTRMTVDNREVLIKVVIVLLSKLESEISANREQYLISLESADI